MMMFAPEHRASIHVNSRFGGKRQRLSNFAHRVSREATLEAMPPARKRAAASPGGGSSSNAPVWDTELVLKPVKQLRRLMDATSRAQTLEEAGVVGVSKEVKNMPADDVTTEIETICLRAVASIMQGDSFSYLMPSRVASNQMYVKELDRVVLKDKTLERVFANSSSARKTAITTRVMQLVLELCASGIHVTKRDLFYTDVKLFKQQTESDVRTTPPLTETRPSLTPTFICYTLGAAPSLTASTPIPLAFTRYCFTSKLYSGSLSSFYCPPLPATPTLLQYYCTTFAQYTPPNRPPLCKPHTIHYW